jgi:Phosphopantetheine attachment site
MAELRENFTDREFQAPEGPLETSVANIFAEVLGVDRIGRSDSFYDFSGTSLQGIRICARIDLETGYQATPVLLFEADDVADFVKRMAGEGRRAGE